MAQQTRALTEIRRRLLGEHGRHRWRTTQAIHDGIKSIITDWVQRATAYRWENSDQLERVLTCTGNPPHHWFNRIPTALELDQELAVVGRRMQGRSRSELRALMSDAMRKKEQDRKDNKLKKLIASITGRQGNPYNMDTLQNLDGSMTSDPHRNPSPSHSLVRQMVPARP